MESGQRAGEARHAWVKRQTTLPAAGFAIHTQTKKSMIRHFVLWHTMPCHDRLRPSGDLACPPHSLTFVGKNGDRFTDGTGCLRDWIVPEFGICMAGEYPPKSGSRLLWEGQCDKFFPKAAQISVCQAASVPPAYRLLEQRPPESEPLRILDTGRTLLRPPRGRSDRAHRMSTFEHPGMNTAVESRIDQTTPPL
jgi:hypothetical protein